MTGLQKKCGVALVCVLLIIGLLTYASFQIEHARMPSVMTTMPQVGQLTTTHNVTATVSYITRETQTAQADYRVASVNVTPGQLVTPTDTLLTLDVDALALEQLRLQEAIEDAEDVKTKDMSAYELAVHEEMLKELRTALAEVGQYIGTNGEIRAAGAGYVESVAPVGALRAGQPLAELALTQDGVTLRWEMSPDAAVSTALRGNTKLQVSFTDERGDVTTMAHEVNFGIASRRYDRQSGRYVYESKPIARDYEIDGKTWTLALEDGRSVTVTLTEKSNMRLSLVPVSAIRYESDTVGKVYLLVEEEDGSTTVQDMQINILEQNGEYAAVQREFVLPVVIYTDGALANGAAVKALN